MYRYGNILHKFKKQDVIKSENCITTTSVMVLNVIAQYMKTKPTRNSITDHLEYY